MTRQSIAQRRPTDRRWRHTVLASLFAAVAVLLGSAAGDAQTPDLPRIALAVAKEFIVPRYAALATATAAQRDAWQSFCDGGGDPAALDRAYHDAADAWSAVEIIHYGPIGVGVRYERMAHWPERKNAIDKALTALLAREDLDALTPEQFAGTSVAGQGLSGLERLLFDPQARNALTAGPEAASRCVIGRLIATSLATIASDAETEWSGPDGMVAAIEADDPEKAKLIVTRIATDLLSIYQLVGDLKLDAIMGESPDRARPALAEGRRAARSSRALQLDLESARALTQRLLGDRAQAIPILTALDEAIALAAKLPPDFGPLATDEAGRLQLAALRQAVRTARDLSNATLPAALGITLGFNSLDGD